MNVAEIIRDHVTLDIESFDRLYLNAWIPNLQTEKQLLFFLSKHRGNPVPSPVLLNKITKQFVSDVEAFVARENIPYVQFERHQRKDDIANTFRRDDPRRDVVTFVGVAQERQFAFKARKDGPYEFHYSRQSAFVKHYYFYFDDADFGPGFIKIGTYAPFPIRLCINGHEWAKRQLEKRGIDYQSLDNGFFSCSKPQVLQKVCDSLSAEHIAGLFSKWINRIPFPLTRHDRSSGYHHELSIKQLEFSKTQVFDKPARGREFFESVIRENLDLGRPERVQILFGRKINKRTPGRFSSRILTSGVIPSLHVTYKSCDVKQYFKEGRALRTETTINNTTDLGIGKRIRHLDHLKKICRNINSRVLESERVTHECVFSSDAVERLVQPSVTKDGQRVPGFRFGDSRVMALFSALTLFLHLPHGFRNKELRAHISMLLGGVTYSASQMTYDLRRLRLKGIITRKAWSSRYFLTPYGTRMAVFLTRVNKRVLSPGLEAVEQNETIESPLSKALNLTCKEVDSMLNDVFTFKNVA